MKCNSNRELGGGVIFVLLLYTPVVVSGANSFLQDNVPSNGDTVFRKFLRTNILQKKYNQRAVTVIDATPDQLDDIRPFLNAVPHFIARNGREICAARELAPNTILMQFLSSLKVDHVPTILEDLLSCLHTKVIFVLEGDAFSEEDLVPILESAFANLTKIPILLNYNETSVKLYGYGITGGDCLRRVTLIMDWLPGLSTDDLFNWQRDRNRETCHVLVFMTHYMPWMRFNADANGELRIVGGFEGEIILTIAKKLKFTPTVKLFKDIPRDENYTTELKVKYAVYGNTSIAIAQIRPDQNLLKFVDMSTMYAPQHMVWCVPRITGWKSNIVTSEFCSLTWMLVGLTFLTSFVLDKFLRNVIHSNTENTRASGSVGIILNIIGITLGTSIMHRPFYVGDKVLLLVYLVYSIVITTAYKTSLASLLTAGNSSPAFSNLNEVIAANLTIGGHRLAMNILQEQLNEYEQVAELIKRYEVVPSPCEALRRVSSLKNFAYLTTLSELGYDSKSLRDAGVTVSFDVLDNYVLRHSLVMIFQKHSRFTRPVNAVTQRLVEGGLIENFRSKYFGRNLLSLESLRSSGAIKTQVELVAFNREKYYQVFIIYCMAMIFCIPVFLGELVVHEFKYGERFRRLNDVQR